MNRLRPLPAGAVRAQPWANGRGETTELACDDGATPWRWRLSIAKIAQDAGFSSLPGVRRQLVPLDDALDLRFADGGERHLRRLAVTRFDGGDAPYATLPGEPTRAFNLMLRGDAEGELIARPLNGAMLLPAQAGWRWFVHLLAGRAEARAADECAPLHAGGSLWIDPAPGERQRIEGGGELVLVRLAAP